LETSGTGQGTIDFGGITTTGAIYSSLEMDMSDITLYWDLLDNVVGLDIGINAKILDGKVTVVNIADSATEIADFSATIPMLYAGVDFSFPLTGLSAGVNGAYIGYDGSEFSEYHAYVRYDSSFVLGVEAGIKGFNIELDDIDQTYGKLEFSGPYAQLYLHF
jgi:outer membrane protein